ALDIGTEGLNLITATPEDDLIEVDAGILSIIYAGQGQDTITLRGADHNLIVIGAGSADIPADSSLDKLDEIIGFRLEDDAILSARLYPGGDGGFAAPMEDKEYTHLDIDIKVERG